MKDLQVVPNPILYCKVQEIGKRIKVFDCAENLEWLLSHFGCEIKTNLMTQKREIIFRDLEVPQRDVENNTLTLIEEIAGLNYMPVNNIDKLLSLIANRNTYHPVVEMIKNNPWDGTGRLDLFLMSIESSNPEFDRQVIKTWMVQAIAAAHASEDGFVNNGVLVLQGAQGIGKTSWVRSLNPLSDQKCIRDNFLLDPKDKDSISAANSYWILELGELDATFNKTDIARLKGFITSQCDYVRMPFERKHILIPRRSSYIATVNDDSYLVDKTGNRRWWTISCTNVDYNHGFDMKQIWSEIYHIWVNGHPTYLTADLQKQMNSVNEEHTKIDLMEEMVLKIYNWEDKERKKMTVTDILYDMNYQRIDQSAAISLSRILTKINGKKAQKSGSSRFHEIPKYKK